MHAVISRTRLFAKSDNVELVFAMTCNQACQEVLTDHAVADDY